MTERPRCGEGDTCCGSLQGCGDCDVKRSSFLWFIALVVVIVLVVLGGRHGIYV